MEEWLDTLLAHEADYFAFGATCTRTPCAWFLDGPLLSNYRDCNRALRLRDDGRGPEAVVRDVITHFQARGLPPAADVDPVAEAQGIGAALRRLGATPVIGSRLLMRYPNPNPPDPQRREESVERLALSVENLAEETHTVEARETLNAQRSTLNAQRFFTIEVVPNETGADEAHLWVETVVSDEEDEYLPLWRAVTELEARSPRCRLYLAKLEGQAAGACDLFSHAGWGRIDSVVTVPAYRRRGVASRLVARAVADSLALGNTVTYLFTEAGGASEQVYRKLGFTTWAVDILRRHICW